MPIRCDRSRLISGGPSRPYSLFLCRLVFSPPCGSGSLPCPGRRPGPPAPGAPHGPGSPGPRFPAFQREDGHPGDRQAAQVRSGPDADLVEPDVRAEVEQVGDFQDGWLDREDGHAPPVSPYGETTSPAPARTSFPTGALPEARAMILRSGLSARAVGVMNTLAAPESTAQVNPPGALDAGLPEHGLGGPAARHVPDAVPRPAPTPAPAWIRSPPPCSRGMRRHRVPVAWPRPAGAWSRAASCSAATSPSELMSVVNRVIAPPDDGHLEGARL
jgi:hypothetical protein